MRQYVLLLCSWYASASVHSNRSLVAGRWSYRSLARATTRALAHLKWYWFFFTTIGLRCCHTGAYAYQLPSYINRPGVCVCVREHCASRHMRFDFSEFIWCNIFFFWFWFCARHKKRTSNNLQVKSHSFHRMRCTRANAQRPRTISEHEKQTDNGALGIEQRVCVCVSTIIRCARASTISLLLVFICMRHNRAHHGPETKVNRRGKNIERQKMIIETNIHWKIMHKMVNGTEFQEISNNNNNSSTVQNQKRRYGPPWQQHEQMQCMSLCCHTRHPKRTTHNGESANAKRENERKTYSFWMQFLTNFIVSFAWVCAMRARARITFMSEALRH